MRLPELCIERPVFAWVLSLVVLLLGVIAYQRLTVREYPNIDPPVVTVTTRYPGASAEIIESQVTQVLEESLGGIEGIDFMSSISREEQSQITVTFLLSRDADATASDVRDRVSRVRRALPEEIDDPVIEKVEADAQPIMFLAFSSNRHTPLDLSDIADRRVKDRLQTLPGVAQARIFGQRRYSMRIYLNPERLAAHSLTVQDVETALSAQNLEVPGGRIEGAQREFTVLSETDLRSKEQFDALILRDSRSANGGYLVRLSDVGRAELGAEDERVLARLNGKTAVALGVIKQSTANPLEVSQAVRAELPRITKLLPEGMQVEVARDTAVFIEQSIANVYETIAEAVALVILIIFFFLRSLRATLIPLVTIPVSLIGACAVMYALGFSLNTLTLLALVLAIGLVVDDAIVMLENIHRHIEQGSTRREAAIRGSREIGFAIIAMTLTLVAVFIPVGFQEGTTGKLFTEFAWTLAGAVLVSGFVALTLSPMMCSRLLREHERHGAIYNRIEALIQGTTVGYRRLLGAGLRRPLLVLAVGLGVAATGAGLFRLLKSELAPAEDQGSIIGFLSGPEGATIEYMDASMRKVEAIYAAVPEIRNYFVVVGNPVITNGISFANLTPWQTRERTQQEIAQEITPKMFGGIPGVRAFPTGRPPLGQPVRSLPIGLVVQTTGSYAELDQSMQALLQRLQSNPGLINPDTDLKLNKPQLRVTLDREKVAILGVSVATIGRTLETLLGGRKLTRFKREGEQYDVIVQLDRVDRRNPNDLARIYVRGAQGMVQLANLVQLRETVAPRELNHFDQLRAATLTAGLAPGYSLGEALDFVEAAAAEVLPDNARVDFSGLSREFKQSSASLWITFGLALAFIYLVLAAQFESFLDPLIILLTVPLSIAGALLALKLSGGTLNIYSKVGLVTLIGLITKHGILIVEFSNQLRAQGRSLLDAVTEAAVLRLRPILMTTGAMVLGALPLAVASGAGAESRQEIGWVIVGGLLVGTLFTLFVIPVAYSLLARFHQPALRST
ncbi:MAG: efflux RND transporter permease subunit [Nevskiales bacterium]